MPTGLVSEQAVRTISMPSDADLFTTTYQFYIGCIDTTDYTIKVATDADSTTEPPIGVIYDKPKAKWANCLLAVGGAAKVECGDTFAAGDAITCDGSGLAIATTTAGDKCIGRALSAGAVGNIAIILLGMFMYEGS